MLLHILALSSLIQFAETGPPPGYQEFTKISIEHEVALATCFLEVEIAVRTASGDNKISVEEAAKCLVNVKHRVQADVRALQKELRSSFPNWKGPRYLNLWTSAVEEVIMLRVKYARDEMTYELLDVLKKTHAMVLTGLLAND